MTLVSRRRFVGGVAGLSVAALGAATTGWLAMNGFRLPMGTVPQVGRVARLGYIGPNIEELPGATSGFQAETGSDPVEAFRQGLRERGWSEGQNLAIEWRFVEPQDDQRQMAVATELVGLHVDVIVALSVRSVSAAMQATSMIPIVMGIRTDPIQSGFVASLAHPGGNVTGLAGIPDLNAKLLELFKALDPGLSRVGALWDTLNPGVQLNLASLRSAAQALGVEVLSMPAHALDEIDSAFAAASGGGANGLVDLDFRPTVDDRAHVLALAERYHLPGAFVQTEYVEQGGLIALAADGVELIRRLSYFVDRILRGASPADIPVEQPTSFLLAVNRTTAGRFGLTIPPDVAAQVTEWVQ
jgi:putative tryptophan/tyrosine transport system substrate-binding protein